MIGLSLHEGEGEAHAWLRSSLSGQPGAGRGGSGASSLPSCSAGLAASWTGSTPGPPWLDPRESGREATARRGHNRISETGTRSEASSSLGVTLNPKPCFTISFSTTNAVSPLVDFPLHFSTFSQRRYGFLS